MDDLPAQVIGTSRLSVISYLFLFFFKLIVARLTRTFSSNNQKKKWKISFLPIDYYKTNAFNWFMVLHTGAMDLDAEPVHTSRSEHNCLLVCTHQPSRDLTAGTEITYFYGRMTRFIFIIRNMQVCENNPNSVLQSHRITVSYFVHSPHV